MYFQQKILGKGFGNSSFAQMIVSNTCFGQLVHGNRERGNCADVKPYNVSGNAGNN
jgi:hypothetical protein